MKGGYLNPKKMYLAGVWSSYKGPQVLENLDKLNMPIAVHAFVIKGEGLDYKVLDS